MFTTYTASQPVTVLSHQPRELLSLIPCPPHKVCHGERTVNDASLAGGAIQSNWNTFLNSKYSKQVNFKMFLKLQE